MCTPFMYSHSKTDLKTVMGTVLEAVAIKQNHKIPTSRKMLLTCDRIISELHSCLDTDLDRDNAQASV